jgi:hypothetical protein
MGHIVAHSPLDIDLELTSGQDPDPHLATAALSFAVARDPLSAAQESAAVFGDMVRLDAIAEVQQSRTDSDCQEKPQHIHAASLTHCGRYWPQLGV